VTAEEDMDVENQLDFAKALARRAGALLRQHQSAVRQEDHKGYAELVTEVDRASEQMIVSALRERFPEHAIEAEEGSGWEQVSAHRWFVDPLDGTNNYAHGYPHFCVSLGLWRENVPVLGVVYDPVREETFWAVRQQGAFLNGRPMYVSGRASLEESLVSTGFPYDKRVRGDNNLEEFTRVALRVRGIRRSGVAALDLCYVAAGRQEAHWEMGLKPWDTAAGALIVEEAGGRVTAAGKSSWSPHSRRLVVSNGLVHDELVTLLGW
jgi:myo-inositol-1(or 4)-monophosphatase